MLLIPLQLSSIFTLCNLASSRHSKCCFVFLDLHHHVMNINEFTADWQPLKRMLGQDFLKPVIILDQLRKGGLSNRNA